MIVKAMYYDLWKKNEDIGNEINEPDWDTVAEYICSLDGKLKTQVTLHNEDNSMLFCVGGGNDGLYNVYITLDDNESYYSLVDSSKAKDKTINLVTGGQLGQFEEYLCVTLDKVLIAAKTFLNTGKVDETLTWEYIN